MTVKHLILTPQVSAKLIRIGIIVAVLALSAVLGWRTPNLAYNMTMLELIIGGIVVAMLLVVTLRRIEFGVFALILTAFLIRFTIPTGTASRIPASMALTMLEFGVWIIWMFLRHQVQFVPARVNAPLLGFIIVALISYPWSWLSWRPEFWIVESMFKFQIAQLGGLLAMIFLPIAFLMALNLLRDEKWVKWILIVMAVIALPELAQRLMGRYFLQFAGVGVSGPGLYHSWLVALLYAQLLFNKQLPSWVRALFVITIVGWVYWGFFLKIKWVSGWLPLMVSLLFITYLKSKRSVIFVLLLMTIPFLLATDYYYEHVIVESVNDDSNRLWLWQVIIFDLTLTKAGIVFGAGPAGYTPYFMTYYPLQSMSAHNNYVDIIAETGIVGTFFFLWFLFEVFRAGWKQTTSLKDDWLLSYNNGVLGGFVAMLAAMMLDDWFIPFVYNNGLPGFDMNVYAWVMLGLMVGLSSLISKPTRDNSPVIPQVS